MPDRKEKMFNFIQHCRLMFKEKPLGKYDYCFLIKRNKKFLNPLKNSFPKGILKVMLGLTYKCQCGCSYCGCAVYDKNRTELSCSVFKNIIREISNLSYFFICISFFGGEPLLRKDIFELIAFTRKQGLFCELDSNGILLTSENVKQLKKAGLHHIFVSIDSTDSVEHDKIKNINGCYQAAVEGIKNCLKENLSCSISTYASRKNILTGEIGRIVELGRKLRVSSVRILSPAAIKRWRDESSGEELNDEEKGKLKRFLEPKFVYLESTKCNRPAASKRCACLDKGFFYISPYGDVQPCPYFPVSFGNITGELPLNAILERMWSEQIFNDYKDTDCLTNNSMVRDYFAKINSRRIFPINY
ncbi:MAG: radical SAM/SPASM domain-containing protein [Candidatus Omnitrophota bacterium]